MPNRSKEKGTRWEREIVKIAQEHELKAERCWGSDGRSRGLPEEVDLVIDDNIHVQAKVRKSMAAWLIPSDDVDVTDIVKGLADDRYDSDLRRYQSEMNLRDVGKEPGRHSKPVPRTRSKAGY